VQRSIAYSNDSEREYGTSESEIDEDEYEQANDTPFATRRSSRTATRDTHSKQLSLPFSPRKTRANKDFHSSTVLLEDSDDELALSMSPALRRSNRSEKSSRRKADEEEFTSDNEAGEGPRPKKAIRLKGARPAYGRFRPVDAIDYDSDEETAVLRAHRDHCAKCGKLPAHIQRQKLRKTKPKKRKARREEDEFEGDDDEETKITKLGGWVRWCVYFDLVIVLLC
jgi:chromodomain-helicase-DNA-binding protein 4